ncbi:hypothetical protein Tco_1152087, partial [Tanacetum coccineum]
PPWRGVRVHLTQADIERFSHGTHSIIAAAGLLNTTTAMLRQACHVYNIHVWIDENGIPIRVQTPIGDRTLEVINAGVNREIEIKVDTPWLLMEPNIRGRLDQLLESFWECPDAYCYSVPVPQP